MNTGLLPPQPLGGRRLFTIAEVNSLPSELPSGPVRYELDNGRLLTMPPAGDDHGVTESNISNALHDQGKKPGHGTVRSGDVGIVLWRLPDRLVGADVAFITNASLPVRLSPEGYLETIPELIVEVRSKNDTVAEVERKVADYFHAGVKLVWVPDPAKKTITVYRPGLPVQVLGIGDTLTADEVIPGFKMPVANAFD